MQDIMKLCDEDGTIIGKSFADLFVDNRLIIELQACRAIAEEHIAQVLGYLRCAKVEHGLLINFGSAKFEIKKYALSDRRPKATDNPILSLLVTFASFASFAFFRG